MSWEGLVREGSPSAVVTGPRVVASMPLGMRATLLERGQWAEVRAALEAGDPEVSILLEELRPTDWFPVRAHVALVEATALVLGLDGLRTLGAVRTQESIMGGLFPNVLRSWVRSFRDDPRNLIRIGPQIWQTAFRELGEFVIDEAGPTGARLRIVDCEALAASSAWRHLIEGTGAGILQLAGLRGRATFTADGPSTTRGEFEWAALTGS